MWVLPFQAFGNALCLFNASWAERFVCVWRHTAAVSWMYFDVWNLDSLFWRSSAFFLLHVTQLNVWVTVPRSHFAALGGLICWRLQRKRHKKIHNIYIFLWSSVLSRYVSYLTFDDTSIKIYPDLLTSMGQAPVPTFPIIHLDCIFTLRWMPISFKATPAVWNAGFFLKPLARTKITQMTSLWHHQGSFSELHVKSGVAL